MPRKIESQIRRQESQFLKELSLGLFSAILLILSFPKFNLEFLAWFGFTPLFCVLQNKSKGKAFLIAYFTGVMFWFGIIYWLIHVTLPGMLILVSYLALYFGIFGLIISTMNYELSTMNLLFVPSLWVLLESLRSHLLTGFPWALLGYSQYLNLSVIQIADITGVWGVSFLVMMVNVAIKEVISNRLWVVGKKTKSIILPIFLLILSLGYGYYRLHLQPTTYNLQPIRISVVQGNIPQELKWNPQAKDFIIDKFLTLTSLAVKDKPDLIIWPEAALPVVLEEERRYYESIRQFVKEINIPLLLGAVTSTDSLYYNSALLISQKGQLLNKYNKLHLVPFGEYIPLRKTLGFLETIVPIGDFTYGKEYTIFKLPDPRLGVGTPSYQLPVTFSALICFEDLFPRLSREFVKRGADFLVNITNDAWFKNTSSPYQHLQASVFRAVENRIFLIRSANTGVSGFIAPNGKIISLVTDKFGNNTFISGYNTCAVILSKRKVGFYTRYGDVFVFLLLIFSLYAIFRFVRLALVSSLILKRA